MALLPFFLWQGTWLHVNSLTCLWNYAVQHLYDQLACTEAALGFYVAQAQASYNLICKAYSFHKRAIIYLCFKPHQFTCLPSSLGNLPASKMAKSAQLNLPAFDIETFPIRNVSFSSTFHYGATAWKEPSSSEIRSIQKSNFKKHINWGLEDLCVKKYIHFSAKKEHNISPETNFLSSPPSSLAFFPALICTFCHRPVVRLIAWRKSYLVRVN